MIIVLILLAVAMGLFAVFEIIHYICFYYTSRTHYYDNYDKGYVTMSWKELRDFYKVNPSRWFFGKTGKYQDFSHLYYLAKPNEWYVVNISMISYFRLLWHYHLGNPMTEDKAVVLECVQEDIDKLREKAQARIDEANEIMTKVMENLKKGK